MKPILLKYIRPLPASVTAGFMLLSGYLVLVLCFLNDYFIPDINIRIGLLLAPYILVISRGNISYRFAIPFLICLCLLFFIPVRTCLFLVVLFGSLLAVESCMGKTNHAFFFLLLTLSPAFIYFNSISGYTIRLWLTGIAGTMLSFAGIKAEVAGLLIFIDGKEFAVDTACGGIKMMMISFILGLFMLAWFQRRTGRVLTFLQVVLFLAAVFILNVFCNLLRIIFLIVFAIPPENPFHDVAGILCLVMYVLVPAFFIARLLFRSGKTSTLAHQALKIAPRRLMMHIMLLAAVFYGASRIHIQPQRVIAASGFDMPDFKTIILKSGITKMENDKALIYLKPVNFYSAEHNPTICWKGSGFEFRQIKKETVAGVEIFTGIMSKGNEKIFTSWWFDNKFYRTSNQLDWRWRAAKGENDFFLVNVNSVTRDELISTTVKMLSANNLKANEVASCLKPILPDKPENLLKIAGSQPHQVKSARQ